MNAPSFFTFRKPADWMNGIAYQLDNGPSGLTIVKEQTYRYQQRDVLDQSEYPGTIIEVVADPNGRWYLLDEAGIVWRFDAVHRNIEPLVRLGVLSGENDENNENDMRPLSIAIQSDSIVVLMHGEYSMLQAQRTDRAQIRWTTEDWYGERFHALTVASDGADGWIAVAAIGSSEQLHLLHFDVTGSPTIRIPLPFTQERNSAEKSTSESMEINRGYGTRFQFVAYEPGKVLLMDRDTQQLLHIQLTEQKLDSLAWPIELTNERVLSMCLSKEGHVWLLLRSFDENTESHSLISMTVEGKFIQRGFTGNAHGGVILAHQQSVYLWNAEERNIYRIEPISETAVWDLYGSRMGVWISLALDSGEPETEWHKFVLQAKQYNSTQINIRYYASEHREAVVDQMRVDLDQYLLDPHVAPDVKLATLEPLWSQEIKDPHDALLYRAKGRYLWLIIELIGSPRFAPVIESLEIYFPRQSYLHDLPSIYSRDERSSDFLSRYLSLFQTMMEETDGKINDVTRILEANNVSGSSLRWLLGWLGIEANEGWTDEQLRQLLVVAPQLYAMRGTKLALETIIQIYTGEKPIILEYDQVKPLKETEELGEVADRLYAADPHVFNVLVKAEHADTEMKRNTLQQIIEAFKPVFASFKLIILQPWVYMDFHSYLGMNTVLSEPTLLTLDGRSSMPHHTITIDVGQDNRIDQHTRLGLNSRLE